MAEELTDAEVFGTALPELTDEEVFANLAPLADTKQEKAFQRMVSGAPPTSILPTAIRMAGPVAALALMAPETAGGAAAVGGISALLSDLIAQGGEVAQGTRPNVSLLEAGVAGGAGAVPIVGAGLSPIAKIPLNAAVQGTTATAADLLSGRGFNPISTGVGTIGGSIGPAMEPVLSRGLPAANAVREGLMAGRTLGQSLRQGAATAMRPVLPSAEQLVAQTARGNIARMTGVGGRSPVEVPIPISEAIGLPDLTFQMKAMKTAGGELTPEQLNAIADTAFHFAGRTSKDASGWESIKDGVYRVLGDEQRNFNAATQNAVDLFSRRAERAINDARAQSDALFDRLYPGGRSPATIGRDIGATVDLAYQDSKKIWDDAYESARALTPAGSGTPYYQLVEVDAKPIIDEAESLGLQFAKNADGGISIIAAPPGARGSIAGALELQDGKMTLDQARSIATELGRRVRKAGVAPGIDTRNDAVLLSRVQSEIEKGIRPYAPLRDALDKANSIYRENIDRFRNSLTKGILSDLGEKGALLPETLVARLTGPNAESYLDSIESIVGKPSATGGTVGVDLSGQVRELVQEAFLSQARAAGTAIGSVDLGKAFDDIRKIPQPVRAKLFPNFNDMEDAALQNKAVKDLTTTLGDHSKLVQVPMADLQRAFGSRNATELQDLARQAIATSEANTARLRGLSIEKLPEQGEFDVFQYITDPQNSAKVAGAMRAIDSANPDLGRNVRSLYMTDLLEKAGKHKDGTASGILEMLQRPSPSSATGQGSLGGASRPTAESVLGASTVNDMREIAGYLKQIPTKTQLSQADTRPWWRWWLEGSNVQAPTSKGGLLGLAERTLTAAPALRYRIGVSILTDQNLRRQAMQASGPQLRNIVNQALGNVIQELSREFGGNSQQVRVAEQARAEVQQEDAPVQPIR